MKKLFMVCMSGVLLVSLSAFTSAHHSAAPFDFSSQMTVEGKVKEFQVRNPHSIIILEVTDAEKGTREVEFEGMSASTFYRAGYNKNSVLEDDIINITIAPRFTGEDGGFVMSFVTTDGENIGFRGPQ